MDDLIKRQDAITAYCEHECGIKGMTRENCGCDDCGTIFDDIPPAQPQKECVAEIKFEIDDIKDYIDKAIDAERWTPCSEGLPEETGRYLVSGIWASGKTDVGDCVYSVVDGCFETAWNFDVVAWKPLPEPYKGEES